MMLPSHGPEPCASANSATSAYCGRWDLNPHEHTPTRSLVLPVCQFQHSRLLLFIFACRVSHSLTKLSIAQALRECKHFFVFFFFYLSNYSYIFIVSFYCKIMYFSPILPLRSSLKKSLSYFLNRKIDNHYTFLLLFTHTCPVTEFAVASHLNTANSCCHHVFLTALSVSKDAYL